MKCLICGSENIQPVETMVSEFVSDRIGKEPQKTQLCFCKDCTFAYYDYRLSDEENTKLYRNYRDSSYQITRQKYEYWYNEKVNNALNNDAIALSEQQRVIKKIISENIPTELKVALDYGGNEGRTFCEPIGTQERYVYDISGVNTINGVNNISDVNGLHAHSYDFIMCNMLFEHLSNPVNTLKELKEIGNGNTYYYIEVPSENPFVKQNKFSISKNLKLLFSPLYNKLDLVRYYLKQRKMPFMPMKEHVNFFTVQSMRTFIENNGFSIIDIQENFENGILGKQLVLSVLFKKS